MMGIHLYKKKKIVYLLFHTKYIIKKSYQSFALPC